MDPSPINDTTGRSGAAIWAPTDAGRPQPSPPPAADRCDSGLPGRMLSVIGISLLPASLTHKVSSGAAYPTAVHRSPGLSGTCADTCSGTAARGVGADRWVCLTVAAKAWAAVRMSATIASPTGARAASSGSLVIWIRWAPSGRYGPGTNG